MTSSFKEFVPLQKSPIEKLLISADFFSRQKKYDEAIEVYKSVLEKEIGNREALKKMGECLFFTKKFEAALRCFEAFEKLFQTEEAKVWSYACLVHLKRDADARKIFPDNKAAAPLLKESGIEIDYY